MSAPNLAQLYADNERLHDTKAELLLARIHSKLGWAPVHSINFTASSCLVKNIQQDEGHWARIVDEQEEAIQAELLHDIEKQIAKLDAEALALESEIAHLQQSQRALAARRSQAAEQVLQLEKEHVLCASTSSDRKRVACEFAFSRDENGQIVMNQNYVATMNHLLARLKSNEQQIEFSRKQCQQRFKKAERRVQSRHEYEEKLRQREEIQRAVAASTEAIKEYEDRMTQKVKNFESRVNEKFATALAAAVQQKWPEKERHQLAYSELSNIVRKMAMCGGIDRAFMKP